MIEIDSIVDTEKYIDDAQAVIFDLDDTLYPEIDYVRSGFRAAAKALPQIYKAEEKFRNVFLRGGRPFDEVLSAEGMESQKDMALTIYRTHIPDIHPYPGAREMLARIRKAGKKTGIITDGRPEGQRAKIEALNLQKYVDEIIVTDELGGIEYRKPNPTAFEMMQENFGVPFGRMVYVGDNILKDFIAPEKLGMKSIWFKNPDGIHNADDTHTAEDTHDVATATWRTEDRDHT